MNFICFWLCWVLIVDLAFSSCEQELLASHGTQASLCSDFSCCEAWTLGCVGFSSCRSWALEPRLNSCAVQIELLCSTWGIPRRGIKPVSLVSPALAGGFITTESAGSSPFSKILKTEVQLIYNIVLVSGVSEVKVAQSCLTLCDPKDSAVHGILQARMLEWVGFPISRGSSQPRD